MAGANGDACHLPDLLLIAFLFLSASINHQYLDGYKRVQEDSWIFFHLS